VGIPDDDMMRMTASEVRRKGLTIKLVRRMKHSYPRAIAMVEAGIVDVAQIATHVFSAEHADEAFALVDRYGDGVLRAVIQMHEQPE
jgi:L-iditol 2-dehydrogenase